MNEIVHALVLAAVVGACIVVLTYVQKGKAIREKAASEERQALIAGFATINPPQPRPTSAVVTGREQIVWVEPASLLEDRVTSRKWEGGSAGVSVPLGIAGIRVNLGKTQGRLVSSSSLQPVAHGEFVVTTRHLIFSGNKKSHKTSLAKVLNINVGRDGIIYGTENRVKNIIVAFADANCGEVIQAAIEHAYKRHELPKS